MQIMQIISLNMHDLKMYEAESDSTEKITLESVETYKIASEIKFLQI